MDDTALGGCFDTISFLEAASNRVLTKEELKAAKHYGQTQPALKESLCSIDAMDAPFPFIMTSLGLRAS